MKSSSSVTKIVFARTVNKFCATQFPHSTDNVLFTNDISGHDMLHFALGKVLGTFASILFDTVELRVSICLSEKFEILITERTRYSIRF